MEARLGLHDELSAWFADRTDAELADLLGQVQPHPGWGMSRTLDVAGHRVFAKTIPVTDLELADPTSTRNHFELPIVYNYGVGSAGFGAAREVAAHVMTTQWVIDGAVDGFPLLYHHRLLPIARQTRQRSSEQLDRYVDYWDGDPTIRRFIEARQASTHSITMFIEHVPHTLQDWLPLHQDAIGWVIEQGTEIVDFLRARGAAHLDAHLSNMLTDGKQLFLTDFGMYLDEHFDLVDDERDFLRAHRHFDVGEFFSSLDWSGADHPVELEAGYLDALAQYRPLIDEMSAVFGRLTTGPKHGGGYDDSSIEILLDVARPR